MLSIFHPLYCSLYFIHCIALYISSFEMLSIFHPLYCYLYFIHCIVIYISSIVLLSIFVLLICPRLMERRKLDPQLWYQFQLFSPQSACTTLSLRTVFLFRVMAFYLWYLHNFGQTDLFHIVACLTLYIGNLGPSMTHLRMQIIISTSFKIAENMLVRYFPSQSYLCLFF